MLNSTALAEQLAAHGLTCGPWTTTNSEIDGLAIEETILEQPTIEGNRIVVQIEPTIGYSYLAQDPYGRIAYWGTIYRADQVDLLVRHIKLNLA
jgi:hypothetical protein